MSKYMIIGLSLVVLPAIVSAHGPNYAKHRVDYANGRLVGEGCIKAGAILTPEHQATRVRLTFHNRCPHPVRVYYIRDETNAALPRTAQQRYEYLHHTKRGARRSRLSSQSLTGADRHSSWTHSTTVLFHERIAIRYWYCGEYDVTGYGAFDHDDTGQAHYAHLRTPPHDQSFRNAKEWDFAASELYEKSKCSNGGHLFKLFSPDRRPGSIPHRGGNR